MSEDKKPDPDPDKLYQILQDLKVHTRELDDFKIQREYRDLIRKYSSKIEKYRN